MPRVELANELAEDFDRLLEHLLLQDVRDAGGRIQEMIHAFDVLQASPLIGRRATSGKRELVIGRRGRGCVTLHRYTPEADTVLVLAIRSQREGGDRQLSSEARVRSIA